jgi:hypothetical protein
MVFILITHRSLFSHKNSFFLRSSLSFTLSPYSNINLTLSTIFLLGFKATFHITQFTLKGLYFIEVTDISLIFGYHPQIPQQAYLNHTKT